MLTKEEMICVNAGGFITLHLMNVGLVKLAQKVINILKNRIRH